MPMTTNHRSTAKETAKDNKAENFHGKSDAVDLINSAEPLDPKAIQRDINAGKIHLTAELQNKVEVLTGQRLHPMEDHVTP